MTAWSISRLPQNAGELSDRNPAEAQVRWEKLRKTLQIIALICLVLSLVAYLFSANLQEAIRNLVSLAYQADPHSLLGKIFARVAVNASSVPAEAYANKAIIQFTRLRSFAGCHHLDIRHPRRASHLLAASHPAHGCLLGGDPRPAAAQADLDGSKASNGAVFCALTLLAGILLGALTSIRILGPLAGLLVALYFLLRHERLPLAGLAALWHSLPGW